MAGGGVIKGGKKIITILVCTVNFLKLLLINKKLNFTNSMFAFLLQSVHASVFLTHLTLVLTMSTVGIFPKTV